MRIRFYLKRPIPGPKASKETKALYKKAPHSESTIFALVNYGGNTLKVYTGESINPKFWNPATQQARATPLFIESPEFNQRLNNIRGTINRVFLDYRNRHDHASPSVAILKPLIEAALKKGVQSHNFLTYFDDFVSRSNAGQRIDPKKCHLFIVYLHH